jgi:hypothetical protein
VRAKSNRPGERLLAGSRQRRRHRRPADPLDGFIISQNFGSLYVVVRVFTLKGHHVGRTITLKFKLV